MDGADGLKSRMATAQQRKRIVVEGLDADAQAGRAEVAGGCEPLGRDVAGVDLDGDLARVGE